MVLWILPCLLKFRLRDYHPLWSLFPKCSTILAESSMQSATPEILLLQVWPLSLSLAATKKIDVSFSSSGYLDVSVHRVPSITLFIHVNVTAHYDRRVSPFGYPRIIACLQLPVAFRS